MGTMNVKNVLPIYKLDAVTLCELNELFDLLLVLDEELGRLTKGIRIHPQGMLNVHGKRNTNQQTNKLTMPLLKPCLLARFKLSQAMNCCLCKPKTICKTPLGIRRQYSIYYYLFCYLSERTI